MAEAVELADGAESPSKKSGLVKLIVMVVGGTLLIGGSVALTLFLTGTFDENPVANEANNADGTTPDAENQMATSDPIYMPMLPFTVSLQGDNNHRFLQVTITLMSRDDDVISGIKEHLPVVRNALTLLLSSQTYESVGTRDGKLKLQSAAKQEIMDILEQNGEAQALESVLFTNFVVD